MNKWQTYPQITALVSLWKFGLKYSYTQISGFLKEKGFDVTPKQIRQSLSDWGLCKTENDFYKVMNSQEILDFLRKDLQIKNIKTKPPKPGRSNIKKHILCSDFHLPFVHKDLFKHLLQQKADVLHINGDIYDFYSISRFRKFQPINFKQELNDSNQYIAALSEKFPEIHVTIGNHFWRLFLYLYKNIELKDIIHSSFVKWKPEEVLLGFPNIKVAQRRIEGQDYTIYFYNVVGDFLYGHFEKSSKIVGKPVIQSYEMMRKWKKVFDFDFDKIKYFAQAHTHKLLHIAYEYNTIQLFETGCMCDIQEYAIQPDMKYDPPSPGYVMFEQENGQTIPNSAKIFVW